MSEDLFAEKLAWFKQNEKPEAVLVIADNPELIKIIIAWTNLEMRRADELTNLVGESESEIWGWLWENNMFTLTDLKSKSGVPYLESVLESKLKLLIGNRVIYPDGTVNSYIQRYLRDRVLKLFEIRSRKSDKRTN